MNIRTPLQQGIPGIEVAAAPLILQELQVYNWGPFGGLHIADIDPRGTAIIGPTGSGKTTLVDALMTLLTAQPRYNLASTGGHESDRDLMSYIRGVTGAGNESGDNSHISRTGKTVSGVSALFANKQHRIQVAALIWVDSASFAASDRKDLWLVNRRDDQTLEQWLQLHTESGARGFKQYARETEGLRVFDTKKAYLAELRQFFEVGDNAFALLNRASGLKQLNSVDEIFRELVLDDRAMFSRALEVAQEFDDLADIHAELDTARQQQRSLEPIAKLSNQYDKGRAKLQELRLVLSLCTVFFALQAQKIWAQRITALNQQLQEKRLSLQDCAADLHNFQAEADTLREVYLQVGGNTIEQLREQISTQQELTGLRRRSAEEYQKLCGALSLPDEISREGLEKTRQQAHEQQSQLQGELEQQQQAIYQLGAQKADSEKRLAELRDEIRKIESRPGSNLPSDYQEFRADLASRLGVQAEELPFVAELLEVKPDQQAWRGAIERALGAHRLRLLVPPAHVKQALHWVNQRDNRLHIRLLDTAEASGPAEFLSDGFTRKLNFKKHAQREALKSFLAGLDRHCVSSAEQLQSTPHAMTAEGLMSGIKGRFDKHDQRPLNRGWLTGFDNQDRLRALSEELEELQLSHQSMQSDWSAKTSELSSLQQKQILLEQILKLDFDDINLSDAEQRLSRLQERLLLLQQEDSEVSQALQDFKRVEQQLEKAREQERVLHTAIGGLEQQLGSAEQAQARAALDAGEGLNEEQESLASKYFPEPGDLSADALASTERDTRASIEQKRDKQSERLNEQAKTMVRLMHRAQDVDTGALSEAGTELVDVPVYLERLTVLNKEALPEKLQRFQAYLNRSSDQGVSQLLADIENEVGIIEDRISDLNNTLRKVDFQAGRYLQLEPRRIVHDSLATLQKAQRHLRAAALNDEEGEVHYRALETVVSILRDAASNRRTLGSRALLDPRYRLQFAVSVLQRDSGELIETRTGSQGGSGGEKEIIASYILTASLSYALCPPGALLPLFGTIVLDEAFSKSSQAVAGRIISALREFGLHPLFVTPNKEMRLLREHTRSAILVHRKGERSSLASLSWEELEAHARGKLGRSAGHEKP